MKTPHPLKSIDIAELARRHFGSTPDALEPEERRVLAGIARHTPLSRDVSDLADEQSGRWERLADRVAAIGGSWGFILSFTGVLVAWMVLNAGLLQLWHLAFDPYPFIFLNLMLSMLAAVQAPIIMMSQNRQATKDRIAAAHDYEVNLKAELEIMRLHEKIDQLRIEHLEAISRHQAEMLDLLRSRIEPRPDATPDAAGPAG
ncbi:DUF1003 domain-containing protein [Tistrella mobilis]|jgi:uncharacterized membrane protein|uniref:DUF1003 domain-containing protein n=1 Tax=Tistrella mobilis TaxID=171437 RepID=UPI003556A965